MSWYYKEERICIDCKNEFKADKNTISMINSKYKTCPNCSSKNTILKKEK